jgi:hypothetical protein
LREFFLQSKISLLPKSNEPRITSWNYEEQTERRIIEDLLLFLTCGSSSYFEYNDLKKKYQVSKQVEVTHLSAAALSKDLESVAHFQTSMKYVSQHIVVLRKVDSSVVQRFCQVISDFLNVFLSEIAYITIVFNIQNGR